jgi:hypothetical protein
MNKTLETMLLALIVPAIALALIASGERLKKVVANEELRAEEGLATLPKLKIVLLKKP